jgi:hypothetical protein
MSARVDEMTADLAVEQRARSSMSPLRKATSSRGPRALGHSGCLWLASALTTRWAKPLSKHRAAA